MSSFLISFRKWESKHQVQAKSLMQPRQQGNSAVFWAALEIALSAGGGKCCYSALIEHLEHWVQSWVPQLRRNTDILEISNRLQAL